MFSKRYDELNFTTIKEKWKNNKNPIGVYLHSPFCPSLCKYCIYTGNLQQNKEEYDNYYNNYLPKVIGLYSDILEEKKEKIQSWFFGGGTPSLMTPETMRNIFSLLPNLKNSKGVKTFEIHPAYWNKEQLDILQEYNFDTGIICLQTLDRKTLIKQKRVPADFDSVVELANELRKRNINIFVDIISFLNENEDDSKILDNDLEKIYEYIKPDEITIATLFQRKDFVPHTIECIYNSKLYKNNEYNIQYFFNDKSYYIDSQSINKEMLLNLHTNNSLKCFRISKKDNLNFEKLHSFEYFMDAQYINDYDLFDTLAIGSYRNEKTKTYSNISRFNYIECNEENDFPTFKFVSGSFLSELKDYITLMEEIGEPNGYFEIKFANRFSGDYVKDSVLNPTIYSMDFFGVDEEYVEKLQNKIEQLKSNIYQKSNENKYKIKLNYKPGNNKKTT